MQRFLVAGALLLTTAPPARSQTPMSDGDAAFAAALHGELRSRAGNLTYSPASVRLALAMAWAGARGDTAAEMQEVLSVPPSDAVHARAKSLLADWERLALPPLSAPPTNDPQVRKYYQAVLQQQRVVLRVVNRLWVQAGRKLREKFVERLRGEYRAPLGELDFLHDPEMARVAINRWVADAAEQKVKEPIAPGLLTADTRLVITSAVYFKAPWSKKFERSATQEAPFFAAGGKQPKVPLMRRIGHYPLARRHGATLLELPYGDGLLAMDVLLPDARDGLARLEEDYAGGGLLPWLKALGRAHVEVMLPRFKTSSSFDLGWTLRAMGMPKAFTFPGADFSAIDGTHELFLSSVVHQAFVDVDENGTEAAAASAGVVALAAPPPEEPVVFCADHPFLFFIRDTQSGVVLFAGRLADPS